MYKYMLIELSDNELMDITYYKENEYGKACKDLEDRYNEEKSDPRPCDCEFNVTHASIDSYPVIGDAHYRWYIREIPQE